MARSISDMELKDILNLGRAKLNLVHRRPKVVDGMRVTDDQGNLVYEEVGREEKLNLITNTGRVQLHAQCYGTSGLLTNGFNYIALTDNASAPAAGDTALTGEITTNGLARAQGTVTLASGSETQTTIAHTFTKTTSSGTVQKCALFTASSGGVMNHEFQFTQRTLQVDDQLDITITITLGA